MVPQSAAISVVVLLLYTPFFFLILIPTNSIFVQDDVKYRICTQLPFQLCRPERTLLVIKPDGMSHQNLIVDAIRERGFRIVHDKNMILSNASVDAWYTEKRTEHYYPQLQRYLTRGSCRVLELERVDAIQGLRRLVGPTNPIHARRHQPHTLRAWVGTTIQENAVHASDSVTAVAKERAVFWT